MKIMMIPGNPPAVAFYQAWLEKILKIHSHWNGCVSPYPCLPVMKDSAAFFQLIEKGHQEKLKQLAGPEQKSVVLIGHSLGGHFALRLLKSHSHLVHRVFLLHPFLKQPGLKGKTILRGAASLSKYNFVSRVLIKNQKFLSQFFPPLSALTSQEISMALEIARHEEVMVARQTAAVNFEAEWKDKVHAYCHAKDTWCPRSMIKELSQLISVEMVEAPHDFIVHEHHPMNLWGKILASI